MTNGAKIHYPAFRRPQESMFIAVLMCTGSDHPSSLVYCTGVAFDAIWKDPEFNNGDASGANPSRADVELRPGLQLRLNDVFAAC
jgi:hypothetical protein